MPPRRPKKRQERAPESPPAKVGRPTKLTPDLQSRIVAIVRKGNFRCVAAAAVGLGERTFTEWMAAGEADPDGAHGEFARAVIQAEQEAEMDAVEHVQKRNPEWFLERKFHDRWGRRDKVEVTGKGGGPVRVDTRRLSDDQLDALDRIVEAAAVRSDAPDAGGVEGGEGPAPTL